MERAADRAEREEAAREARSRRYARRDAIRPVTGLARLRECGRKVVDVAGVTLGVRANDDGSNGAAYGGLSSCGSVWCCPQCAAKVATRRADELADVMRAVELIGGSTFFVTGTVRHHAGDGLGLDQQDRARWHVLDERRKDLANQRASAAGWTEQHPRELGWSDADNPWLPIDEDQARADETERAEIEARRGLWDHMSYMWGAGTQGAEWDRDKKRYGGLIGWVRVMETTDGGDLAARAEGYSGNGWHVHIHALVCFRDPVSTEAFAAGVGARMGARFARAAARRGLEVSLEHGWDIRRAQLGEGALHDYFMKLAHEATSSHRKEGKRKGGRTPMQLLADATETYRVDLIERWWTWERASRGRRQLEWSRGRHSLRTFAGLGAEKSDEAIAAEEQDADVRLCLPSETWAWITYTGHTTDLLDVAETLGLDGARAWLTVRGLAWGEAQVPPYTPMTVHQPYGWRADARQVIAHPHRP